MCALDEWPSHARRYRVQLQDEADGQKKKKGQGVVKGVKAVQKRFANGSAKLNITFSETLGGKIGMNYRSFKDDVVVIMKRKVPLIGVRRWSDIHPSVHRLIVADVIDRWDLEDTPETEEKILRIAQERYRGWRSTLSSTYKAFKTDDARLANVPEDLQPEEWEWMINYFGNDEKFQARSQVNSDNRKKQKTKHRVGSKSYAQLSFEKRNLETGEEPDCVALWELTHTKNGTWSNPESQEVYDKAREAVQNKETETKGPLSTEQRNNVFQTAYKDTVQCKSSQPRGYGYKAKPKTGSERLRMQIEDQARVAAETLQNSELSQHVSELEEQLEVERANMQQSIDFERSEREQLEVLKKRNEKENINSNLQTTLLKSSSPNRNLGANSNLISTNSLLQAATLNSRMYKAMFYNCF
ncbi:uncharacterized protein [Lolium perenne]|uniref:uncharacterized protein n=1 Tax=Lolium perenne TaxID=4522 RepID=UPI003A9A3722